MYPVSEAFLQAVQGNARAFRWSGRITTKSGAVHEFTDRDILKGSGSIRRQCCGSTEIELGTVYAAELGITLFLDMGRYSLEGAVVEPACSLRLADGSWETVPMGIYEVSEANRGIRTVQIVAYDYMLRFEKSVASMPSNGHAYDFLEWACGKCNVALAHTQEEVAAMPNGGALLGVYPDGNIGTYRDLLFYVAQALGRVCQINREGKLELVAYPSEPVMTFEAEHRFRSTYSDFVTRYTGVHSTNEIEAISEYYCLDPDDGLTMNLGINPLLQYGYESTREELITNILGALSAVRYVPFDSSTIGNPALDPMDAVRFSGGHADGDAISCITSATYRINGKQDLKGVGKNPQLSSAKSKTDKNIIGLLNQVETGKYVVCAYENPTELAVGDAPVRIIEVVFASVESTSALFVGNVCCTVTADEVSGTKEFKITHSVPVPESIVERAVAMAKAEITAGDSGGNTDTAIPEITYEVIEESVSAPATEKVRPAVTFRYKMDDLWVEDYAPREEVCEGAAIFPLLYPMGGLSANSARKLEVYMEVEGGTLTIAAAGCKAAVAGSGIAGGYVEWDGLIVVEESVGLLGITAEKVRLEKLDGSAAGFTHYVDERPGCLDTVALFRLEGGVSLFGLRDTITGIEEADA